MNKKVSDLRTEEPLRRIPTKDSNNIRYISFNVNSIKTLFKYHPWNQLTNGVDGLLSCMDGDIVSLQELKVQPNGLNQVGLLSGYKAFVLIPRHKKGYSGVGLYVRIPSPLDSPQVVQNLTVVKAEEGITGLLVDPLKKLSYQDCPNAIGGYLTEENFEDHDLDPLNLLDLDNEGRCAVVELANNTVVFSVYCPANSLQTPEGQDFRLRFLKVMLQRCLNLRNMGKKVIVMGDMNVSPDLIDNAEAITLLTKTKRIVNNIKEGGEAFEKKNLDVCLLFKTDGSHRTLFNLFLKPTLAEAPRKTIQFLHDTTREYKKRQVALYTVWNTQTNSRQSNYGSRIDLILTSCPTQVQNISRADILPYLYGSDHCPVFTDFNVSHEKPIKIPSPGILSFEARNCFKLVEHRDISSMFSAVSGKRSGSQTKKESELKKIKPDPSKKIEYSSRKVPTISQQPINSFFFGARVDDTSAEPVTVNSSSPLSVNSQSDKSVCSVGSDSEKESTSSNGFVVNSIQDIASILYNDPPLCKHKEPSTLKTSYTQASKGKKFWCCARTSKGSPNELGEHRCNFFAWAVKKP